MSRQCCATCTHIRHAGGTRFVCGRLGYETQPRWKFDCWQERKEGPIVRAPEGGQLMQSPAWYVKVRSEGCTCGPGMSGFCPHCQTGLVLSWLPFTPEMFADAKGDSQLAHASARPVDKAPEFDERKIDEYTSSTNVWDLMGRCNGALSTALVSATNLLEALRGPQPDYDERERGGPCNLVDELQWHLRHLLILTDQLDRMESVLTPGTRAKGGRAS